MMFLGRFDTTCSVWERATEQRLKMGGLVPFFLFGPPVPGTPLNGPFAQDTALIYAKQIAGALEVAHEKGIIHRDRPKVARRM